MRSASALLVERHGGDVLEATLARPDSYNAINAELRDRLIELFTSAERHGARAILLTGQGNGFCAGVDLKSVGSAGGFATTRTMRESTQRLVTAFLECPVPVVAAVHGATAGIGLTLALGADVCVAADDARLVPAFLQRGIVPDGALAHILPRLMGMARAKSFLLRGAEMSAKQAVAAGAIAECVPLADLRDHARNLARELAELPTVQASLLKEMLSRSFSDDVAATLSSERIAQGLASTTEDAAEGRRAFVERRTPVFRGF
ncbi:enoyl-CoA hydratase-related protein [Amycolatopsis sp. NPDC006131]|uniref:enoyl-CoA hydratase/isomerase family protein n=1 Tax=Amycolatopsis sp. NPDC006131 TaxID=3156731 RepID=UPI00339E8D06